jgi:hypothetical protein
MQGRLKSEPLETSPGPCAYEQSTYFKTSKYRKAGSLVMKSSTKREEQPSAQAQGKFYLAHWDRVGEYHVSRFKNCPKPVIPCAARGEPQFVTPGPGAY